MWGDLSLWFMLGLTNRDRWNAMPWLLGLQNESAKQQLQLGSHEAELNRIDTALVGAAKGGFRPPSSSKIFGALSDASIVCADVLDAYADRPIPPHVHTGLSRLHCAITDLEASLKIYAVLSVSTRAEASRA
jgi:hypothetical protein